MSPQRLVRSPFLVRVARSDGDATFFHSLFGTSLVLNQEGEAVLDLFSEPRTLAQVQSAARGSLARTLKAFVANRLLVDHDADERAEFTSRMRPHPAATGAHIEDLVLLVAEQCNLACPYCIKDRLMGLRPERRQARMTARHATEAIDAFLAVAAQNGRTDVGLQFRGGEPLLNAGVVFDATRYMREQWTRGSVMAAMVSNATLVTAPMAKTLAELAIAVEVSIDGPQQVHDSIRFTKGGKPTYDRVMTGLSRLIEAGVVVSNINTTITAETIAFIDRAFLAELARIGVRRLNLEPDVLSPVDSDPRRLAMRLLALRAEGRNHGIEVGGCWGRALRALASINDGASLPPPADYPLLIVDALGKVVPWEYNGVADFGPVTELEAVVRSDAFARHVEARSPGRIPECQGCEVEGLCQGNASMTLIYERGTGRRGLFAHRCELIRQMTRGVLTETEAVETERRTPAPGVLSSHSSDTSSSRPRRSARF